MEEIGVRPSRRGAKGSRSTRVENRVRRRRSRCHPAEFVVGPGSPAGGSTQSSPDGRGVDFRHERPCAHPQSGGPPVRVSAGVHLPAQRLGSSASVVRPRPLPHSGGARGQSPSQPGGQELPGELRPCRVLGYPRRGFALLPSSIMGTSVGQIDATYSHLVADSDEYVRSLLEAGDERRLGAPEWRWPPSPLPQAFHFTAVLTCTEPQRQRGSAPSSPSRRESRSGYSRSTRPSGLYRRWRWLLLRRLACIGGAPPPTK